jgi:Ca-activated chloride channel homolog
MKRKLVLISSLCAVLVVGGCGKPAVEITAPGEANAGSEITVSWTGTVTDGDQIAVRIAGETAGLKVDAPAGNAVNVTLPLEDGTYEIAYLNAAGETLDMDTLTITPNTYALDIPEQVIAGGMIEIHWSGPDNPGDYITVVPEGTPEGDWLDYEYTAVGNPIMLQAPLETGVYEIRYSTEKVDPNPTLFADSLRIISTDYAVTAPPQVTSGSDFQVAWTGPDNPGDYITIVPVGTEEGEWNAWIYTADGNPCSMTAPVLPGDYEIRYSSELQSPNPTMAMTVITVVPAVITLNAPEAVAAGSSFEVEWTGPDGAQDYITIVPAGSDEGTYMSYTYTASGSPLSLDAPEESGDYEIRYLSDRVSGTFASIPIRVE